MNYCGYRLILRHKGKTEDRIQKAEDVNFSEDRIQKAEDVNFYSNSAF